MSNNQESHVKIEVTSDGGKTHNEQGATGGDTTEKERDKEEGGASGTGNGGSSHSSSKSHRSSHKKRKNKSRHRYVECKESKQRENGWLHHMAIENLLFSY